MGEGGIFDKAKGRAKEAVGALTGDDELKREGKHDQTAGEAKEKADEVIDRARKAVGGDEDDKK